MKIFLFFKRCVMRSFAYTTIFSLIIFLIIGVATDDVLNAIEITQFLLILLFSVITAFAQELFTIRALPLAARIGIHYATLLLSFILIFTIAGKINLAFTSILIFVCAFSLVYAIILTVTLLILKFTGYYHTHLSCNTTSEKTDKPYTSKFS